jgi:hypothetical protein
VARSKGIVESPLVYQFAPSCIYQVGSPRQEFDPFPVEKSGRVGGNREEEGKDLQVFGESIEIRVVTGQVVAGKVFFRAKTLGAAFRSKGVLP